MEISDEDVLSMTDITVDMELDNAVYVVMHTNDRITRRIKVVGHPEAYKLVSQLLNHQSILLKEKHE